jgi:hypothetical protein
MALTTLARVKEYLSIATDDTADDLLLTRLIGSASSAIEVYCSRVFASATYNEVRDGTGTRKMVLRNFPVTAVSSVTINGRSIPQRPSPLSSGYTFDDLRVALTGHVFDEGVDNVQISYTAGLAAVPADVEQACIEAVSLRYKAKDRLGVTSKSLAGESISFSNDDFPDYVTRVLDQYRVVGLP